METQNMIENSRAKLEKKNLDMICANNLKVEGAGFKTDTNILTLITKNEEVSLDMMSNLMRRIHGALENTHILNCSHLSADTAENRVRMNLYFFSPKSVENIEDREMDRRTEIIIENYRTIYSPSIIENVIEPGGILNCELEINLMPNEPDADLRLA
jgi:hypothetical protein